MELLTTKCTEWKHLEFRFDCGSEIPQGDIDVFVSFLEQSVQSGTRYEDGQLIELGSMILRLVAIDGRLAVQEPDLRSVPIVWTAQVTESLKLLRLQKDIAESVQLGDLLDIPSIRHNLIIGTDLSAVVDSFALDRLEHADLDSGWFIGRLDSRLDYSQPSSFRRISVYEAIVNWPCIAGFLALPTGSRIELSSNGREISRDGKKLELQIGSFLDVATKHVSLPR